MMRFLKWRSVYLYCFLLACVTLGASLYLQFYSGVDPCPLCILQRVVMFALMVAFLVACLFPYHLLVRILLSLLILFIASVGAALAGRQVWLQHFPVSHAPFCDSSLQYMLSVLPVHEVARVVLHGSGDCAVERWTFLTLELSEWSLLLFCFFIAVALLQLVREGG